MGRFLEDVEGRLNQLKKDIFYFLAERLSNARLECNAAYHDGTALGGA